MNQTHPCDLSFKSGRWNRVGCCLFDGRRMAVRKSDGNAERAVGCLTTKSGVSFHMCSNEMISLWKLTTPLLFMHLFIFCGKNPECPGINYCWPALGHKQVDELMSQIKQTQLTGSAIMSPTFNCEALLPITVMSMKYDSAFRCLLILFYPTSV